MSDAEYILVGGLLLTAGLVASLLAQRLRLPSLVLFLAAGMLLGSDATGLLPFDDYRLAQVVGIIGLALIIFEGGLATRVADIRPVLGPSVVLAVVGTLLTALLTGLAASWLLGLLTLQGLLIGAILASTDGAAVFSLMRRSTLRGRLARTLEAEAGMNDPVAVLLVIGFIDWIQLPEYGVPNMVELFAMQLGVGAVAGGAVGLLAVYGLRRTQLPTPGLYPVASLAVGAVAYGSAASLDGSGFLAVYLAGLALGNANIPAKRSVTEFHDGLAWLAQISMFLTLGLLVFPSQLTDYALDGMAVALVLAIVARPVAAMICTAVSPFSWGERVVLSWAGLRGAVPVVLATFPVLAGVSGSEDLFNIVFFAVLLSTVVQGSTFEALARALGVTESVPAKPQPLVETGVIRQLGAEVLEVPVAEEDAIVGLRIRDLGLPRTALVNVIVRGGRAVPPRGSTRVQAGDRLHVLVSQEAAAATTDLVDVWRAGPIPGARRPRQRQSFEAHRPAIHVRAWMAADGDPAAPARVKGRRVVDHLRSRRDMPGALVLLDDGYFAVTGPLLAIGSRRGLSAWVQRRIRRAQDDGERLWWEEVLGVLVL